MAGSWWSAPWRQFYLGRENPALDATISAQAALTGTLSGQNGMLGATISAVAQLTGTLTLVDEPILQATISAQARLTGRLRQLEPSVPCPASVQMVQRRRPRMTSPEDGVLWASEEIDGIHRTELLLEVAILTDDELADVLALWDDGHGAVEPFDFLVPGEGTARQVVFLSDELAIQKATARSRGATLSLLDVTATGPGSGEGFDSGFDEGFG